MIRKALNSLMFVRKNGVLHFLIEIRDRIVNWCCDKLLMVDTGGYIPSSQLGYSVDQLHHYLPAAYLGLFAVLRKIPLEKTSCTLLDYGSGKGRAIIAASILSFRNIIGIELCKELYNVSIGNIAKMRGKRSNKISIYNADAVTYEIPDEVNVIYFFNPFSGEVLAKVVDNIMRSYMRCCREIYIIYFNSGDFDKIVVNNPLIIKTWQKEFRTKIGCSLYVMGKYGPQVVKSTK